MEKTRPPKNPRSYFFWAETEKDEKFVWYHMNYPFVENFFTIDDPARISEIKEALGDHTNSGHKVKSLLAQVSFDEEKQWWCIEWAHDTNIATAEHVTEMKRLEHAIWDYHEVLKPKFVHLSLHSTIEATI